MLNATNVLSGAPDQLTTGAILSCEKGAAAIPTSIDSPIAAAYKDSGYISEDGLTLTPERSTEAIRDWSGTVVRELLTEFMSKLAWAHLETNEESLKNYFGDDNVTVELATASDGKQIQARLGMFEMPRKQWIYKIKDGKARILIVVPDGQINETGEVAFVKSGAITWPVVMTTYPDQFGVNVYVFLDDGQVLTAGVPLISVISGDPDPAAAGDLVTITGQRMGGATAVTFGGVPADDFIIVDGESLVATMPAGVAGPVDVVVTNAVGDSSAVSYTRA